MRKLTLIVCVLGIGSMALGAETVDNPAYKSWAAFKPGTMVKSEMNNTMTVNGAEMATKVTLTSTLKEVTPEKVVVEVASEASVGERKMPVQVQKAEIMAKVAPTQTQPANAEKVGEGDEQIELLGKKYSAHWMTYVMKVGDAKTTSKMWTVKEIPGGMAKMESKTEGAEVNPQMKMAVVEFKVAE